MRKQQQLENNIQYIADEFNLEVENYDAELLTKEEAIERVRSQVFDIRVINNGDIYSDTNICENLKTLGDEVINETIIKIFEENGLIEEQEEQQEEQQEVKVVVPQLKKYMVYLDCGENCVKEIVPAINEQGAREFVEGNGRVIYIEDVTADYSISTYKVAVALESAKFDQKEIDVILRTLSSLGIAE